MCLYIYYIKNIDCLGYILIDVGYLQVFGNHGNAESYEDKNMNRR